MTGARVLLSWRDGPTRSAIVSFVDRVVTDGVPLEARVAVFDADGTLWCEKPAPVELELILRRMAEMAGNDASLRQEQPWKAAYEKDSQWFGQVIAAHYGGDDTKLGTVMRGVTGSYAGISVEDFEEAATAFLRDARHPSLGRRLVETAYVPMVELLGYLAANGFSNYIVSGSGADFMRPISQDVFGIPPERVLGSATGLQYSSTADVGTIVRQPSLALLDDGPQKPLQVWSHVGRRPLLACGNSNGDIAMLEYACLADRPSLRLLVDHDDGEREFSYTSGAEQALAEAQRRGWTVVSMKNDFATVFAPSAGDGSTPAASASR